MIVYRLEDDQQRGPFSSWRLWPGPAAFKPGQRPLHIKHGCTVSDIPDYWGDWRFGTRNLTQMRKYFGHRLPYFLEDGWVIAMYKVRKNYTKSSDIDIEVAFLRDKATRIGVVDEEVLKKNFIYKH